MGRRCFYFKRLAFSAAILVLVAVLASTVGASGDAAVCKECPACPDCSPVEARVQRLEADVAAARSERDSIATKETEAKARAQRLEADVAAVRSERDSIATKEKAATAAAVAAKSKEGEAKDKMMVAQKDLQKCNEAKASAEEARAAAEEATAVAEAKSQESECDEILESRRELAASLEQCQSREAQLTSSNRDLEARRATTSNTLKACDEAKSDVEAKKKALVSKIDSLIGKFGAAQSEAANLKDEVTALKTKLDIATKEYKELEDRFDEELSKEARKPYLFSLSQLVGSATSFWTFMRTTAVFVASSTYKAAASKIPDEMIQNVSRIWSQNTNKVVTTWNSELQPRFDTTMRSLSSSDVARLARTVYDDKVVPSASVMLIHAKKQAASALAISAAYTRSYVDRLNDKVDEVFVVPLTDAFPEVEELIPDGAADRCCLLVFVLFIVIHMISHARLVMRVLLLAAKLAIPCCWLGFCARRDTKGDKGQTKPKPKRARKSFQPAAASGDTGGQKPIDGKENVPVAAKKLK